ncbi:hypothetical protein CHS0354_036236 [Potamilus streckersoni]|uniref:Uncharacterized protein n=1 Tax=Potamilus streckersoni TaxID=2493646 RepID=A0AAE0W3B4_9BIVA|nr:hypothetical protein CHS0354_036236 [Potamilus streckersoni]
MSKRLSEAMYSKNDILTLNLEVHTRLKSVINIPNGEIGMLKMKRNDEIAIVPDGFKPLKDCMAELLNVTDIKLFNDKIPWYTKVTFTSNNQLLMVDNNNKILYLVNLSYNIVCCHTFSGSPWDVCMVCEEVVAVTLPHVKSIHILFLKDKSITYIKNIQTKYKCYGIAAYSHEELIVSGQCGEDKYYWSIITLDGKEKSYHEFDGADHSLHCFGLDGAKHFTFTHHNLKGPQSVSVDRDDNVYLVGCASRNIFQLSPDGFLIHILLNRKGKNPMAMCFDQNGDKFVLSHVNDTSLSTFRLAYKGV